MHGRNHPLGFAERTSKNLQHIEAVYGKANIHVVTQVANSLLGLIVFPWEKRLKKGLAKDVARKKLKALAKQGWPEWKINLGTSETLGDLVRHLRNAVAHGRMEFSSDHPDPSLVMVDVRDCEQGKTTPYWSAEIGAVELRDFCLKFIEVLGHSGTP
jgi:hypothetical protein